MNMHPNIDHMAQNIETVRGTPWEEFGQPIPAGTDVHDTLKLAGLDWPVLKRQAWVDVAPTDRIDEAQIAVRAHPAVPFRVSGNYVLIRGDTMEPISPFVGSRYKQIQNEDAFDVFREFCDAGDMQMETAGSLFGGKHVWGMARIKGDYTLCDGEIVRGYFLLTQSHVYGTALKAQFTPVRFPGGHSLVQPVNKRAGMSRTYSMSHSRHWSDARRMEVREVMGVAQTVLADFVDEARAMTTTNVTEADAVRYFIEVFHPNLHNRIEQGLVSDIPNRISDLAFWDQSNRNLKKVPTFMADCPGAKLPTCAGTIWGMVQSANYAFDHVIGHSPDTRLMSSWMGPNAKTKLRAMHAAQKLV